MCLVKQSHVRSTFKTLFFALCYLVWDCFGVHKTLIHKVIPAERRAMTGPEWEGAVRLLVASPTFQTLRRMENSSSQKLSDCAAEYLLNRLFYNRLTPTE
jgi:hypothetical protein